ncbi:NIPSNAP family containing protein [Glaciibacter flavus]|uniref:NIPSNAP family containing protein n=1 Tax=Orlajensenia flava TaxID=2565934 RepID=A0A4S4G1I5_9MICO|nr:NIPSNAP family containing protein [Glaciibacter flavus]THG36372.1 NIPSNAP family containing protein [Glaciibacter flavus]
MPRTVQLRRYTVTPELVDEFLTWWSDRLLPARIAFGFTLEFAVMDRASSVFTWAVSLPTDAAGFVAQDEEWAVSPGRMDALRGTRQRVVAMENTLVEKLG